MQEADRELTALRQRRQAFAANSPRRVYTCFRLKNPTSNSINISKYHQVSRNCRPMLSRKSHQHVLYSSKSSPQRLAFERLDSTELL